MSIILHTGIPGCGKTYYVMHEIMYSGVQEKYFILHNIKGFKPQYFNVEYIRDWRTIAPEDAKSFFSVAYFEKIVEEARTKFNRPVLLIVDEAWEFFEKLTDEQLEFFSWHRHIGMDIWLVTQDATDLDRGVRKRAEYDIRGNKSTVIDEFLYTFNANRSRFRVRRLKKRKEVFQAYESFDVAGAEKQKSRILQYALGAVLVASVGLIYGIGWAVPGMFGAKKAQPTATPSEVPQPPKPIVNSRPVKPPPVKAKGSGVQWNKYSLASVMGDRVLVQDESGRLISLTELIPDGRLIEYANGCATVWTGASGIESVCKRSGIVKAKPESVGGRGGVDSPPPTDSGKSLPK